MVCEYLSGETCQKLDAKCFKLGKATECDFRMYYNLTINRSQDAPLAQKIKGTLLVPLTESWKEYAKSPAPGKKRMTASPFETVIRTVVKEQLASLGATVAETSKKYPISKTVNIFADCVVQKEGHPDCLLSMKTWIGGEQLRETFTYAYLAKAWHGEKNVKVCMVVFQAIPPGLKDWVTLCKSHVDGVYSLSGEPYIDKLLEELWRIYG